MSSLQMKIEEPTKGVQIKECSTQQSIHKSSMVSIMHLPNLEQLLCSCTTSYQIIENDLSWHMELS
jgi:hypothetical protein